MKRRRFLQAVGAGSVGAGAMVGTGGYSRIRSQRRVKIEVDGNGKLFDGDDISFIAFCATDEAPELLTVDAIEFKDENGEPGDPVTVEWEAVDDVDEIVIWTGEQTGFYLYFEVHQPNGIVTTRDDDGVPEEYLTADEVVDRDETDREPNDPCLEKEGTKFDWNGDFVED